MYYFVVLVTFDSFLVGGTDIDCAQGLGLPKWPINQLKLVLQNREQTKRAYCQNKHTVGLVNILLVLSKA